MMIGKKYGRLTVLHEAQKHGAHRYYMCECDCGNKKAIRKNRLVNGITKSCGCLRKELAGKRFSTHGLSRTSEGRETRLHRIWANIVARCTVPTHQSYKNYGGRGISVCSEWLGNYLTFHNWAMVSGYKKDLTIDRIDNDGGYSPENCQWVTKGWNGRNQRTTKLTIKDASRIRNLFRCGHTKVKLSEDFGVSVWHITNIVNNNRWKETVKRR